jgi:hypothetical protein
MNGETFDDQSLAAACRVTDAFIAFLEGAAPSPLPCPDLPAEGQESGFNGSPSKSYCITDLPNGGVQIVNAPDEDDDRMEARR